MTAAAQILTLVTVMGTGNYHEACYAWGEHPQFKARLFPLALIEWLRPARVLTLLTQEAEASENWKDLIAGAKGKTDLTPVRIPTGKSEAELWEIFSKITEPLQAGSEIVFDITHGFRSLPLFGLLAAQYAEVIRQVRIRHLLYGAFDAKDALGVAPVFDLAPFLKLSQWLRAAETFTSTGDGEAIGGLLMELHRNLRQAGQEPRALQRVGQEIQALSKALLTIRPRSVAERTQALRTHLAEAEAEIKQWAPPFSGLLDYTYDAFTCFRDTSLATLRDLVEWYLDHGMTIQSVSLSREWLVSWVAEQIQHTELTERPDVEKSMNTALYLRATRDPGPFHGEVSALAACYAALFDMWDQTSQIRNDLAHCGFNQAPMNPDTVERRAREVLGHLKELPLP